VVTLSGRVDSFWQKKRARRIAANVSGVVDVVDDLRVVPLEEIPDEDIRNDILSALERSYIDASDVEVFVDGCVVILKGTVYGYTDYRAAESIAAFTNGVCDVRNQLTIA
jgi:osmotically-inducible protein OsmY